MGIENTFKFFAFRYFVVESSQISLLNDGVSPIIKMIEDCKRKRQISINVENRMDILTFEKEYDTNTFLFKFSRDFPITKYVNDDFKKDIIEITESNYPYIYVIIDVKKQIVLLERKTSIYPNATAVKNAFKAFVLTYNYSENYTFSMDEIIELSRFWNIISNSREIFELTLNLKSPNLFGGMLTTNDLLKKTKETYNNDEIEIKFKNSKGKLKINREIDDAIKYAGSGGGSWKITRKRDDNMKKETLSSKSAIKIVEITGIDNSEQLRFDNDIIKIIKQIDDIF